MRAALLLTAVMLSWSLSQSSGPAPQDLATAGVGAPFYRIPALTVTTGGTLLATYDARPTLADLPGPIAIVLRRSVDGGRTWSAQATVRAGGPAWGFGDPSLLVDRITSRVFLFHAASRNQGFLGSHTGRDHDDPDVLQADYSYSDDDGLTWQHRRITKDIKNPSWGGIFAASGQGIQILHGPHAGRLVQQYVIRYDAKTWAASAFSDDHGDHWQMGALVGPDADENKSVERSVGLAEARARATDALRDVGKGEDPGRKKIEEREAETFTDRHRDSRTGSEAGQAGGSRCLRRGRLLAGRLPKEPPGSKILPTGAVHGNASEAV